MCDFYRPIRRSTLRLRGAGPGYGPHLPHESGLVRGSLSPTGGVYPAGHRFGQPGRVAVSGPDRPGRERAESLERAVVAGVVCAAAAGFGGGEWALEPHSSGKRNTRLTTHHVQYS